MEETQGHIGVRTAELMQDDIVLLNGKPVWVKAILDYDEVMVAETEDSDEWEQVYAMDLEPAELTEGWLKTFGYKKKGGVYIMPEEPWNGKFRWMPGYWHIVGREAVIGLSHVHDLQHLLRMIGAIRQRTAAGRSRGKGNRHDRCYRYHRYDRDE